jgi:hypothetical protein
MKNKSPGRSHRTKGREKTNSSQPTLISPTGNCFDEVECELSLTFDCLLETKAHIERAIDLYRERRAAEKWK